VSIDALLDEVRRRRTPQEALHVTAILVFAETGLDRGSADRLALARIGWSAVRAEGATDRFPSLSHPTLELVRTGVDLSDEVFLALPEDDRLNVVLMGFLSLVGERLADEPPVEPAATARPRAKRVTTPKPAADAKPGAKPVKPGAKRPKARPGA
jgi:hypothetical protein